MKITKLILIFYPFFLVNLDGTSVYELENRINGQANFKALLFDTHEQALTADAVSWSGGPSQVGTGGTAYRYGARKNWANGYSEEYGKINSVNFSYYDDFTYGSGGMVSSTNLDIDYITTIQNWNFNEPINLLDGYNISYSNSNYTDADNYTDKYEYGSVIPGLRSPFELDNINISFNGFSFLSEDLDGDGNFDYKNELESGFIISKSINTQISGTLDYTEAIFLNNSFVQIVSEDSLPFKFLSILARTYSADQKLLIYVDDTLVDTFTLKEGYTSVYARNDSVFSVNDTLRFEAEGEVYLDNLALNTGSQEYENLIRFGETFIHKDSLRYPITSNFEIVMGEFSWDEAKLDAEIRGGRLADIESGFEHIRITNLFTNYESDLSGNFLLGGRDYGSSTDGWEYNGDWKWINGKQLSFHHFEWSDWSLVYGENKYVALSNANENFYWQKTDGLKGSSIGYILEIESEASPYDIDLQLLDTYYVDKDKFILINAVPLIDFFDYDNDGNKDSDEDVDGDGKLDLTEDLDGDGKLDSAEDIDGDLVLDINEDVDGDGKLDSNEDIDGDGNVDVNEDIDGDGRLDIAEDVDGDGRLDVAEDIDGDGRLDISEDLNGDGTQDLGEDRNGNGILDPGEDRNGNDLLDKTEDLNGSGLADFGDIDFDQDGKFDITYENFDNDGNFDVNEDIDGDGVLDITEDLDGDGNLDVAEDIDGDGKLDVFEDVDNDGNLDVDEDLDGDGKLDLLNEDIDGDGNLDIDEDVDGDGKLDDNEDIDGDLVLDIDEDVDGDGKLDSNEDIDGDGILDVNEDIDGNGILDVNEDIDGDGKLDELESSMNLKYQWYLDGYPIPENYGGNQSQLWIGGIEANEGLWEVNVSNVYSSVKKAFNISIFESNDLSDVQNVVDVALIDKESLEAQKIIASDELSILEQERDARPTQEAYMNIINQLELLPTVDEYISAVNEHNSKIPLSDVKDVTPKITINSMTSESTNLDLELVSGSEPVTEASNSASIIVPADTDTKFFRFKMAE